MEIIGVVSSLTVQAVFQVCFRFYCSLHVSVEDNKTTTGYAVYEDGI